MNTASISPSSADAPVLSFTIAGTDAGKRLDAFLTEQVEGWSRSRLQRLIEDGDVLVNEKPAKASYKLHENDEIDVDLVEVQADVFEPENIPLDIVFEDEFLAVINKPAGMVVHPGAGINSGTLANAIAYHFSVGVDPAIEREIEEEPEDGVAAIVLNKNQRVGIVHRLDKDTSGLIVVAKNQEIHEALSEQFRDRTVQKKYVALVHGSLRENFGTIDRPMARDRWHRTKMTVAANGRQAITLWKVRTRFEKFTLVDVEIKTGRTHQIRVHLASLNHPVVGDETYNEGRDNTINDTNIRNGIRSMNRFFLHSANLSFTHPQTEERLAFTSELPEELAQLLKLL
ncbi:MAG TPA: RluA family pseudouridine synthase [Pyrinomonadaceae bacterium]|nr:RluA family pseudouridine synthase [Pyrinomonadaceae bacterium]